MDKINFKKLDEKLVRHISKTKNEPSWMLNKRLNALDLYKKTSLPKWGPDLSGLDLENILYYSDPNIKEKDKWEDLPKEITDTFDKLGIPEAEKKYLGGVGAQYDSASVYHSIKKSLEDKGIIFEDMNTALQKYPLMVKKYFMTDCVSVDEHKFTMMHCALWSGGTFIYIPKGVDAGLPLQAYFRMNARRSAQFEHTIIVADEDSIVHYIEGCSAPQYNGSSLHAGCVEIFAHKRANVKYSSIENWSRNTYNLNTKKALVYEDANIHWVNGNIGSGVTMLYPSSVLLEDGAMSDSLGVAFSGKGQIIDVGSKAIHIAKNTSSIIRSKSISKDGGVSNYRGIIKVGSKASGTVSSMVCDALILDDKSESNTYPAVENKNDDVDISHEARVGRIGEEEMFFMKSRGFSEEEATRLIVGGFVEPIIKALPLEYAVELNKLISLEMT
jgi:Fe-S cluster assembly protein SufB